MPKSNVTLEQLMEGITRPTGATHTLILERIRALVWELDEPHFNPGSAVFLPGLESRPKPPTTGYAPLQALKHVFDLAEQNSAMKILVVGHSAAKEGSQASELSKKRADSVLALLKGERATFASSCELHGPRDIQLALQWAALVHGLGSLPGKIDGIVGPKTRAAMKRFRASYNSKFSGQLAEKGEWGKPDWEALYDLYEVSLARQLSIPKDKLGGKRGGLKFDALPSLGCAADWPVGSFACAGQRARTSRRVEVLLVEDKQHGDLQSKKYGPPGWEIYAHELRFKRRPAPAPEPVEWLKLESDFALKQTTALANELTARGFAFWGRSVFGDDIPRDAFEKLHADLRAGAVENVKHRVSADLTGHRAAYDAKAKTTLVSEELLAAARADQTGYAATLACVLVEEFGHYLDDLLRTKYTQVGGDAPKDEGARFGYLLLLERMATPGVFDVATLHVEGEEELVKADLQEVKGVIEDVLGPTQQVTDEQQAGLEFADGAEQATSDPQTGKKQGKGPRVIEKVEDLEPDWQQMPQVAEAKEILYYSLLTAGYSITDANALVDLARKLNERWRGKEGSPVFYELLRPGKSKHRGLERMLLRTLLWLYEEFERRVREAPLTADGMPDLGESIWVIDFEDGLWPVNSPLAGLVEDVNPFGAQREWETRLQELGGHRRKRPAHTQEHHKPRPDQGPEVDTSAHNVDTGSISGAAAGDVPPTPISNVLEVLDRCLGGADLLIAISDLFGLEMLLAAEMTTFAGGLAMQVVGLAITFMRVDMQQEAAAKALGIAFGYFALKEMLSRKSAWLPDQLTEAQLRPHFEPYPMTAQARRNLEKYRGSTPRKVLEDAERAGLLMVVDLMNKCLARVPEQAKEQYKLALYMISTAMKDGPSGFQVVSFSVAALLG